MPRLSESVEIARPAEEVWRLLGEPERWVEGYVETRSRSPEYPGSHTRNDHVFRTRIKEHVSVRVVRSEQPVDLEESHEGKTFSRRLSYRLSPTDGGTRLTVEDEIAFKGLARLAAPLALLDVKRRWSRSLANLRAAVEATAPPA
ncbi:MAG: SRPBCC family protein [Gaiellaceae bacterium]